jgi:succinyl-diaminopimelate desuccinylase
MTHDDPIAGYLAKTADARIAFLQELVRVPSDNPPGDCAAHAARTSALMQELGLTVEAHPVPEALCHAHGMISAVNLIVRRRFGDGPVIALNAHGDVVAPGDGWTHDPYGGEIADGWLYGRGAAVSKSDIATYAYALMALETVADTLSGTVELHITYDEEVGGMIGPKWLLDEGISNPDLALSAGFSHAVVTAHNGCLHLEVTVTGHSAHAAKPETGNDALEAATAILTKLYQHRSELGENISATPGIGAAKLNIGLIEGGINTNVVPDKIIFRIDRRIIPQENAEAVEQALRKLIDESVSGFDGIAVSTSTVMLAEPLTPAGEISILTDPLTRHASAYFDEDVQCVGVPLYTDARHYAAAGIPTVLFGAGPHSIEEANAHRADERLPVADLQGATLVIAQTLRDILSAA